MKSLLDVILILAWLSAYLGVVYCAAQYRRAREGAFGFAGRNEFRAEKDVGVWCVTLVTGVLLGAAAFFAARLFGALS